ncbi:DUF305 domain-containing protein [Ornithinimicrobium faecis]|uniref:DUF305 domain-containing protein n=1 Tax=Ornithinimicrobium faecis TaxID=2934158 RepID=A0ABY4YX54_9MICO|nr:MULTISPECIES: DUF305 domain-containing protein [unclassified Ornithinimicrobium]USQ80943.1 DUF305 domain-containing protein [Ornithinimicrobium sp. HY1793]
MSGLVMLALVGCSAEETSPDQDTATGEAAPTTRVLQPGHPGEDNVVATTAVEVATPTASAADVTFMQEMIVHHAQAIEMADLVEGDLDDAEVQAIAARIRDAQRPEIEAMATWLTLHGHPVPAVAGEAGVDLERLRAQELPADHDGEHESHGGGHEMPGMATAEQMHSLGEAQGTKADLLFLELMSAHHQGALTMLDEHAAGASDLRATEMADEMAAEQQAEIGRMADIRDRLQTSD